MIATEFLAELRSIKHLFAWRLQADENWPGNRRSRTRLRLRAALIESPEGALFDPIGAVCFARTGRPFDLESWIDAADAIELSLIDAADITAAANGRTWKAEGDGRVADSYLVSLRESLTNTVGLDQAATESGRQMVMNGLPSSDSP